MAITIDREQRDAIYEEILTELTGSGDIWAEMQAGDYDAAHRTRDRLEDGMRLLDDLGWEPNPDRETFELTMPRPTWRGRCGCLNDNARATLGEHVSKPVEEADLAQRALIAQTAYGSVLGQLAEARPMSRRRDVGSITVAIPIDAVLAVRSSARMSRDGISDDYEGYRHKGRDH